MKLCVCGREAERFEVYEAGTLPYGYAPYGIIAIVEGKRCCSAFESPDKYSFMDFEAFSAELNERENVDLGIEAGIIPY